MQHFSSSKFVLDTVHSHVNNKILIRLKECCQFVKTFFGDGVETQIDHRKIVEIFKLLEQLHSSIISDATLLKAELLKLVTE